MSAPRTPRSLVETMRINHPSLVRLTVYVLLTSLLSLVVQSMAQMVGQFLIFPVMLPLLFIPQGNATTYLDVDTGSIAAYLFRGLVTGLFWGGLILFPFDMFHRTKQVRYKVLLIVMSVYALVVVFAATVFFLMLATSGWTD